MELAIAHDAAPFLARRCGVEDLQPGLLGPATGMPTAEYELPATILDEGGEVIPEIAVAVRTVANPQLILYVSDSSVRGSGAIDHFVSDGLSSIPISVADGVTRIGSPVVTSDLAAAIADDCMGDVKDLDDESQTVEIPADLAFLCEAWARVRGPELPPKPMSRTELVASIEHLAASFDLSSSKKTEGGELLHLATVNGWISESSQGVSLSEEVLDLCDPVLSGEGITVARIDAPIASYGATIDDTYLAGLVAGGEALRLIGARGQRWLLCPGVEPLSLRLLQLSTELLSELVQVVLSAREMPFSVPVASGNQDLRETDKSTAEQLKSGSESLLSGAQITFARLDHEVGQRSLMTNLMFAPDATATFEVVDENGTMDSASINCFGGSSIRWQQTPSGLHLKFYAEDDLESSVTHLLGLTPLNDHGFVGNEAATIAVDPADYDRPVNHWSSWNEFTDNPDDGYKKFRLEALRYAENGEIVGEEVIGIVLTDTCEFWTVESLEDEDGLCAKRSDRAELTRMLISILGSAA